MSESIWGVSIKLKEGEKVIVDSAEVVGTVIGAGANVLSGHPVYCVKFPKGSVYYQGSYNHDSAWFNSRQLRKIDTGAYVG